MKITAQTHVLKRTLRFVGSVFLLVMLTVGVATLVVRAFTIDQILVDAPGMSIELDKEKFGKNLLFFPAESIRSELLSSYPLLLEVRFEKKIPSTLVVHLKRRQTFAYLVSSGNTYAIDDEGLVLGSVEAAPGFPTLTFSVGILSVGGSVTDPRVRSVLTFLKKLEFRHDIQTIFERDSATIQAIMGNTNILLAQSSDLGVKAATLQVIRDGFRIKGTLPTVIDLRYEKPIITN